MSNSFMTLRYKISMCKRTDPHNWRLCPYAHEGEAGRRRPPHMYKAVMCEYAKSECPNGDVCTFAHNALEYWLHPDKYRTTLCGQGEACNRNICFFAHNHTELRVPGGDTPAKGSRSKPSPAADAADLLAQLAVGGSSSGGGASSSGQRRLQAQQAQQAQQYMAQLPAYHAAAGQGGSRAAYLQLQVPAAADTTPEWVAQQQGMAGMVAQQGGGHPAAVLAALTAAAGGSGARPLGQYQFQPELAAQGPLQQPLVPGAAPGADVQAGVGAAAGAYSGYTSIPAQLQQVVSPRPGASGAFARLAAQQQQQQQQGASMMPGVAAPHGWAYQPAAVAAAGMPGYAGGVDAVGQQGYMMAQLVQGPQAAAAAGGTGQQPVWPAQVYGSMLIPTPGSAPPAYAAWPGTEMQQLQPPVLAQQAQQLLPVLQAQQHGGAALPAMQGLHVLPEEPAGGAVMPDTHRASHPGYSEP